MDDRQADGVRQAVREAYADVATQEGSCCCERAASCCPDTSAADQRSAQLGYSADELAAVPDGANLGLGCGNPTAIAALRPGEVVLDLGSGGGLDCFLAARQVGESGRVIGVDMTPEMVSRARENARQGGYANVEFRLGEIEHLPVADASVDVVLSNCVINLSPDKPSVYREAFRALKPGGRLAVSDVVATAPLPDEMRQDRALLCGCVAGAMIVADLADLLREVGFGEIAIHTKEESRAFIREWAPGRQIEQYIVSADIEAMKPES
jgi:ubiquinone/menaquinone biosynthesis C-methylase UbiE